MIRRKLDPDRLTAPAERLLRSLAGGAVVCREHRDDDRFADGVRYFLEPGGNLVDRDALEELLLKRRIAADEDGLLPDDPQTFKAMS